MPLLPLSSLPCSWTDMMLWATLTGKQELAKVFWRRTTDPLRDALQASRLCRRMAFNKKNADEEPLKDAAAVYESWASGMLDACRGSKDAERLLCAYRPEWENSPIEESMENEFNSQCLDFLAHRQCQLVADKVFAGEYEGSKATIPLKANAVRVLLQALFPILPGLFLPVRKPARDYDVAGGRGQPGADLSRADSDGAPRMLEREGEDEPALEEDSYVADAASWDDVNLGTIAERAEATVRSLWTVLHLYEVPKVKVSGARRNRNAAWPPCDRRATAACHRRVPGTDRHGTAA